VVLLVASSDVEHAEDYAATVSAKEMVEVSPHLFSLHHACDIGTGEGWEFGSSWGCGDGGAVLLERESHSEMAVVIISKLPPNASAVAPDSSIGRNPES